MLKKVSVNTYATRIRRDRNKRWSEAPNFQRFDLFTRF